MAGNRLDMIGGSHIDIVWLWNRAEGMQEVKSTFASALRRMEEFPDFIFTMTSGAFLDWVRDNCPALFEEIRGRVAEGRWEFAGGMWVEPDCNLPSGEALIRHFLYTARLTREEFGIAATVGYSVDSFGHGANLPAILRGCGLDAYFISRPARECIELPPVFRWQSPDGSAVTCQRTGGEYMAWTKPAIVENIRLSEELLAQYGQDHMAVCYGVGNHGGGPTVDNIKSILELRRERQDAALDFSRLDDFFRRAASDSLPVVTGELGPTYTGCYSSDNEIKRTNRAAEWALHAAEAVHAMAELLEGRAGTRVPAPAVLDRRRLEAAWKDLLFCQFHDALSGTCIRPVRDEIVDSMRGALAAARQLAADGVQRIANQIDTQGDGFPLLLVNPTGAAFSGVLQAEAYLPGAVRKPLRLRAPSGAEVPACATGYRHYTPDNRKPFLFQAEIPAMGWAVYRMQWEGPTMEPAGKPVGSGLALDNGILRMELDPATGCPRSLSAGGREWLSASGFLGRYPDTRGAWGVQPPEEAEPERLRCEDVRLLESNPLRGILRSVLRHGGTELVLEWILCKDSPRLTLNASLHNTEKQAELCLVLPWGQGLDKVYNETAFLVEQKATCDGREWYQHRFADIRSPEGEGVAVFNSSAYAFRFRNREYRLILSRSTEFSQPGLGGVPEDPYHAGFMDQGKWEFTVAIQPHDRTVTARDLFRAADQLAMPPLQLCDSVHPGPEVSRSLGMASVSGPGVHLSALKPADDGEGVMFRLHEANGGEAEVCLRTPAGRWQGSLGPYQIRTLRMSGRSWRECSLLEEPLEGE